LNVSKATPELRLTSSGDTNSTKLTRSSTASKARLLNTAGGVNKSLLFDGAANVASKAAPTGMGTGDQAWSMGCWFYALRRNSGDTIMNVGASGTVKGSFQLLYRGLNKLSVDYWGASDVTLTAGAVSASAWHHAVATYNSSDKKLRLYVDGAAPVVSASITAAAFASQYFYVGNFAQGFNGYIDDAQFWNRTLSDAEAQAIYTGTQPDTTNLKGKYTFNLSTGVDGSGTSNDLTVTGATYQTLTPSAGIQAADVEVAIVTSEDGGPVNTFSDPLAISRYDGVEHDFNVIGVTKAVIDSNGLITSTVTGGNTTTSDLYLKTTTGVGAAGADMHFLVGNNGATEAMTILNSGNVGVKTTAPAAEFTVYQGGATSGFQIVGQGRAAGPVDANNGVGMWLGYNAAGNRQTWIGATDALGSNSIGFFRMLTGTAIPGIDAVRGDGGALLPIRIATDTTNLLVGTNGTYTDTPSSKLSVIGNVCIGATNNVVAPTSGLSVQGEVITLAAQRCFYRAITALRTLDATDYLIDCTTNTFTVTLPTAASIAGRTYVIKNSGTGVITIATTSSQTIDGITTQTLNQYDSITVVSNGANWIII
jgi:hypothetical protein